MRRQKHGWAESETGMRGEGIGHDIMNTRKAPKFPFATYDDSTTTLRRLYEALRGPYEAPTKPLRKHPLVISNNPSAICHSGTAMAAMAAMAFAISLVFGDDTAHDKYEYNTVSAIK